jgi:hypothetical protein
MAEASKRIIVFFKGREATFELYADIDSMDILRYHLAEHFQELVMYDYTLTEINLHKKVRRIDELRDILLTVDEPVFKVVLNLAYNLRVGSYNLANFSDHHNWKRRVQRIAEHIREADCDVVGL